MERKLVATGLLALLLSHQTVAQDLCEMKYTREQTEFQLFAPSKSKVKLRIYEKGMEGKPLKTMTMKRQGKDDFKAVVKGDWRGKFYTFDTGHGETAGIFAKAVGVNGRRGAVVDMKDTHPTGWDTDRRLSIPPKDLVVYELHHRDFSMGRQEAAHKGKYLALTEPWAVAYLKRLGVNAVHILPSFDYGSVDETRLGEPQYNWGYDPVNYNVPEGSYSTDPYQPETRIREFKQMVQALHRAGIAVILDVVYNHTYDISWSNFQRIYPDYFYRRNADGTYSNGSGCGNETASEQPMMRRFMVASVKYWVDEYHIDGFRFDLMGCHDIATMKIIREELNAIDPHLFVYGEGWSAGPCALPHDRLAVKEHLSMMPGIAAFSDEMRDALRGPFSDDTMPGWLGAPLENGEEKEQSIKFGIVGGIAHPQVDMKKVNYSKASWATDPTQMIAYVSCHDDMCLTDRLRASIPGLSEEALIRLDLLAQTAVFTSQAIPFMLSGEELLRTKKGVHNSFQSPDSINQLDWSAMVRHPEVTDYYRHLIALRHHHPAFRLGTAELVRHHLAFLEAPKGVVAFRLKDHAGADAWGDIVVVLNANPSEQQVGIPEGEYTVACRDGIINERGLGALEGPVATVGPQSALILFR